jgi:hypothetical protein
MYLFLATSYMKMHNFNGFFTMKTDISYRTKAAEYLKLNSSYMFAICKCNCN